MFYEFDDEAVRLEFSELNRSKPTAGLVGAQELERLAPSLCIAYPAVEMCKSPSRFPLLRRRVTDDCAFVRLDCRSGEGDESIALAVMKNLLLVVDISPESGKNRKAFMQLLSRCPCESLTYEGLVCTYLEIISEAFGSLTDCEKDISRLEKEVIDGYAGESFNVTLTRQKQKLLELRAFYEQLVDAAELFAENENELFDEKGVRRFAAFRDKAMRLRENTDILRDCVTHLWDAYQARLAAKQNEIMRLFTVVTSVFMPMTVIVGWYGMNFKYMPELGSRFGYPFVIFLNAAIVGLLLIFFKKKKWI